MKTFLTRFCLIALLVISLVTGLVQTTNLASANPSSEPDNAASSRGSNPPASGNLTYQGGPVLTTTQTVYFIYWQPSGYTYSPRYRSLLDGFMGNVAVDSGKTTNVYFSATQYRDITGQKASTSVVFGGSVINTEPFPANNCTNPYTSTCLSDKQIRDKLNSVLVNQGWSGGFNKLYFLFLPKNVGSCYNNTNQFCSYQDFCAYHSYDGTTNTPVIFAPIMYAMSVPSKCGAFSHPNGDDADSSINLVSHEHGELITDPLHSAWYNSDKREKADKCFWQFGQHLGWTAYGKYNQQIGTGKYYLQSQWSNQSQGCVLSGL